MKKLFTILFTTTLMMSCTPELSIPTIEQPTSESLAITYVGFPLYNLYVTESETYIVWYQSAYEVFNIDGNVLAANVQIERGKQKNIVFKQYNNGQFTGKYIIYLTDSFQIEKWTN